MIYTGYSQAELDKIIAILEASRVPFEVSSDDHAIEKAHGVIKDSNYHVHKRQGTVENSFYNISIPDGALKGLSSAVLRDLEKHNIFPEMEMLPEEKESKKFLVTDEKREGERAIGMGLSSLGVLIIAIIAWYFFIQP